MILPPKKMRGGIPFITKAFNALREFHLRTRVIPTNGFQETLGGVLPPPLPGTVAGQKLQWVWSVSGGKFSFNKDGGYVYIPLHKPEDVVGDEEGDEQLPTFLQFPAVPEINSTSVVVRDSENTPPTLQLTADQKNLIVLTVPLTSRFENIGEVADGQRIGVEYNPSQSFTGHVTFREKNWAWNGTDSITIAKKDVSEYLSDTDGETIRFLMGWVELDGDFKMIDYEWFAGHSPITLGRWAHVAGDGTAGSSPRNPTGITAAEYPSNSPPIPGV